MKELSIEEKAKRYDEAIEKAKYYYDEGKTLEYANDIVSDIFPELADSDDEKVRKEILEFFSQFENGELRGVDISSWIAWLEKQGEKGINGKNREIPFSEQKPNPCGNCGIATNNCQNFPCVIRDGEQKPADKVEPKFRIGDIIKDTEDGEVFTIRTITKDKYIYTDDSFDWIKDQDEYELVEQKPIDEEMKELLHTEYEKGRADAIEEMQNHIWSEEDCNQIETIACHLDNIGNGAMAESLLNIMNKYKSLRPQNRWKPSDEQIEILDMVLTNESMDDNVARILRELREQLKKLREG